MVEFLSPAWIAALADACAGPDVAADVADAADAAPGEAFEVEQLVRPPGTPGGTTVRYHVVVGPDGIRVRPGPAPEPTLVFELTGDTAASLAQGTLSAQEALAAGALRLRGRLDRLAASLAALRRLADATAGPLATVRARTRFPDASAGGPGSGPGGSAGDDR